MLDTGIEVENAEQDERDRTAKSSRINSFTDFRWIFSETMSAITTTKMTMEMI